jgi:ATP-binding cassette subfamily B protein
MFFERLAKIGLVVGGLIAFVTVYNLFAGGVSRRQVEIVHATSPMDDGAAALTMLLRYHGKPVTLEGIRPLVPLVEETSTALELLKIAATFDLKLGAYRVDKPETLAVPLPCIAQVRHGAGERVAFVVLERMNARKAVYVDPAAGERMTLARDDFNRIVTGVVLVADRAAK